VHVFFFFPGGHQFIVFRGTFFQGDINLLIIRRLFFLRHLLGQPARADGRDPAKITGRFRADFRLALVMVCARRAAAMQLGPGLPDASIWGLTPPSSADSSTGYL